MALNDNIQNLSATDNVRVVAEFSDLYFFKGDKEAAFKLLADDCVTVEAEGLPYGGEWKGADGFDRMIGHITDLFESTVNTFHVKYRDAGDVVLADADLNMRNRRTGKVLPMRVIELWHVVDGKIKRIEVFYQDTKAVSDHAQGK
ncbi:nuclear transport factor 2 family protein [Streptomyces sp. NBC_01320]|uniref:nuclear transport factor 2 family protein n=1 Tax=Streptomyces sp. NBC_01320 TaxID=2903824 RepID=UPI002E14BBC4|nr:nuclear transport factor 2 family protein [Streptomyces sp. NBC_01320]